jgi:hypothetical protein
MQIFTTNNRNFEKPYRNPSNRTKVKISEIFFLTTPPKNLVPRMLTHRENVRKSKFWQNSKEKNQIDQGHLRFRKIIAYACVLLNEKMDPDVDPQPCI